MQQNRDMGITDIRTRKNHVCYGMGLGVVLVADDYPGFPGDVRNASAYGCPVQFEIAEGVSEEALLSDPASCGASVAQAAKKLERMGCRAIAGECGWFAYFQKDVAKQVSVPVFMSSLLQVPFAQQLISPDSLIGIVTSAKRALTDEMLRSVDIDPKSNIVIAGADEFGCTEFDRQYSSPGEANFEKAQDQIVRACVDFVGANPKIGALLLTCTGFPPYTRAIQRAVDLPVFTWGTMLDYAYSVVVHRDYYGHV